MKHYGNANRSKQSAFSMIELLVGTLVLTIGVSISGRMIENYIKALKVVRSDNEATLEIIKAYQATASDVLCEATSIVKEGPFKVDLNSDKKTIYKFEKFYRYDPTGMSTEVLAAKDLRNVRIKDIELEQQTSPLGNGKRRALGGLKISYQRTDGSEKDLTIPLVLRLSVTNEIISCYPYFSNRVACEDKGGNYVPTQIPDCTI